MKINAKVNEITHEELVNLFSTAFFGSYNFSVAYDETKYRHLFKFGDCIEDKLARIVLNKGSFIVYDTNSEKGDEPYGNLQFFYNEAYDWIGYRVTINAIRKGINAILNSTCKCSDDDYRYILMRHVIDFMDADNGHFDLTSADAIMQVILFNEVIYG